jgi:hypothetical protein
MRNTTIIIFLSLIFSCTNKKYSVEIISMDPITKIQSVDTIHFSSSNDTTAFKHAVSSYWIKKASIKRINKEHGQNLAEPFFFSLMDESNSPITFPPDISERLSAPTIQYMKDSVLPKIDTLTPYSKQPKERTANIYN